MHASLFGMESLQERLGYYFSDLDLLRLSLTHPSYAQQNNTFSFNNQRLEFLGDAVLSLVLAEKVYSLFPDQREGSLAEACSILAKGKMLAEIALRIRLDNYILLGNGESRSGGSRKRSILEDAFEALIGALYLDSDLETTRYVVLNLYDDIEGLLEAHMLGHNPKGRLQEKVQSLWGNDAIEYIVHQDEEASPGRPTFTAEVHINGQSRGIGRGRSKKLAEEAAARYTLECWPEKPTK